MKRILGVALITLLLSAAPALAAEGKIAYVDLQKALNTSEAGKNAKEKIAKTVKDYEGTIKSRQDELKKLKDDLEKQQMALSETAKSAKEREYQQKLKDFQRFTKDIQDELQQKDAEFTRQILEDLLKVIKEVGEKEGYAVILEKTESSILYADDKVNITDKVIKAYDARKKAGK